MAALRRCLLLSFCVAAAASGICPYRYYMLQVLSCNHGTEAGWTIADIAFFDKDNQPITVEPKRSSVVLWGGVPKLAASHSEAFFEATQVLDNDASSRFQFDSEYSTPDGRIELGSYAGNGEIAGRLIIDMKSPKAVSTYKLIQPELWRDPRIFKHIPNKWMLKGSNDLTSWAILSAVNVLGAFPTEAASITCDTIA